MMRAGPIMSKPREQHLCRACQKLVGAPGYIPAHDGLSCCSTIARSDGDLHSYTCRDCGAAWMCFCRTQNYSGIEMWERIEQ
jgi:hypothetical protein